LHTRARLSCQADTLRPGMGCSYGRRFAAPSPHRVVLPNYLASTSSRSSRSRSAIRAEQRDEIAEVRQIIVCLCEAAHAFSEAGGEDDDVGGTQTDRRGPMTAHFLPRQNKTERTEWRHSAATLVAKLNDPI